MPTKITGYMVQKGKGSTEVGVQRHVYGNVLYNMC